MNPSTLISISILIISTALNLVAYWLSKPPGWVEDEMKILSDVWLRDGQWETTNEASVRALSQHHLLALIKIFYRDLAFLRGLFAFMVVLQGLSLFALLVLGKDLLQEGTLKVVFLLLLIFALTVAMVGFVPWLLSKVLSGRILVDNYHPSPVIVKPSESERQAFTLAKSKRGLQ